MCQSLQEDYVESAGLSIITSCNVTEQSVNVQRGHAQKHSHTAHSKVKLLKLIPLCYTQWSLYRNKGISETSPEERTLIILSPKFAKKKESQRRLLSSWDTITTARHRVQAEQWRLAIIVSSVVVGLQRCARRSSCRDRTRVESSLKHTPQSQNQSVDWTYRWHSTGPVKSLPQNKWPTSRNLTWIAVLAGGQ